MPAHRRRGFRIAVAATAIPIVALSLLSIAGPATDGALYASWLVAGAGWVIAVHVGIGLAIAGKRGIASGVLAGVGVGALALTVTCFANLATLGGF